MNYITEQELIELSGISRNTLYKARYGYTETKNGKVYKYVPWLVRDRDWKKTDKGTVLYTGQAVETIISHYRR